MSNRAYLIGSNTPLSPGITPDGINYDPNTEILAGASWSIPILWCSVFKEDDLIYHRVKEYRIPTLVAQHFDANRTLITRMPRIIKAFPHYLTAIENWQRLVEEARFEYIKVDPLEVWMLNEDGFEKQLRSAIKWYDSDEEQDMLALASLAEGVYDFEHRQLTVPDGYVIDYCMHGYSWVREVPWREQ